MLDGQRSLRKGPRKLGAKRSGSSGWTLCPSSDRWPEENEDDVPRPLSHVLLSRAESLPSCLANFEAWQLLLYLSTSNQLLSRGPKIAGLRKALRGKQLGRRGLAQLPAWSKCLRLWEVLGMFTLQGRGGAATSPGHFRPLGEAGTPLGSHKQP